MASEDAATRQGVCYGIQEVLANVSRTQLADMLPQLLPTVQTALCDVDASVRAVRSLHTDCTGSGYSRCSTSLGHDSKDRGMEHARRHRIAASKFISVMRLSCSSSSQQLAAAREGGIWATLRTAPALLQDTPRGRVAETITKQLFEH